MELIPPVWRVAGRRSRAYEKQANNPKNEQAHFCGLMPAFPCAQAHRSCGCAALPGSLLADVDHVISSKFGLHDCQAAISKPNFAAPTAPEMAAAGRQYREAVLADKQKAFGSSLLESKGFSVYPRISGALFATKAKLAETPMPVPPSSIARCFFAAFFSEESAYSPLIF